MPISRTLAAALLLALTGTACAQNRLDLRSALQRAETDNLELRAARQQRAIALAGITIAKQIPNPTISFEAFRDVPHESVLWNQAIEIGGKRGARIAVAREEQKATEIDIRTLSRQIRRRTREAFFQVLLTRAQSQQAKVALDLGQQLHDSVQQRFEAGDVAQLDVIQSDVELARLKADYEMALASERSADAQLSAILALPLDRPPDIEGRIEDLPRPVTLEAATQTALEHNPDLQRATQDIQVEQRRLHLAKTQRVPNLDLQAGTDLDAPGEFNVGPRGQIAVSAPIFYHGQGEVAQSAARLQFLRLSLDAVRTAAAAKVVVAFFDYSAKFKQSQQYSDLIIPQSVRLQQMATESYTEGKSNLFFVIDAQRKLSDTRKAYLDSLLATQSAFAVLEEVVGEPLD